MASKLCYFTTHFAVGSVNKLYNPVMEKDSNLPTDASVA